MLVLCIFIFCITYHVHCKLLKTKLKCWIAESDDHTDTLSMLVIAMLAVICVKADIINFTGA